MSKWINARELSITWIDDPSYWQWTLLPECRSEVAELRSVCWLDIVGKIDVKNLLKKTSFGAYLVFKLKEDESSGLEQAMTSVRFVKEIVDGAGDEGFTVFIDKEKQAGENGQFPNLRADGWKEIKLGEFFNNLGDEGEVEMRLFETKKLHWKHGLLVRGIDVRPN